MSATLGLLACEYIWRNYSADAGAYELTELRKRGPEE